MAACRGLQHIFDNNPIPENNLSSFIDSLSSSPWRKIKPPTPIDHHSFTEIFGELHFKENPHNNSSSTSSSSQTNKNNGAQNQEEEEKWRNISKFSPYHKRTESSSSMNSESLQLCTEGLGFESLDNLEDLNMDFQSSIRREKVGHQRSSLDQYNYSKKEDYNNKKGNEKGFAFPPPLSSIAKIYNVGKPWICFESYREDGRFILKEVRIPTQECLHASREDGRLRLCFVQQSDDDQEDWLELVEEDEGEEEEREEEGINGDHEEQDQDEKEGSEEEEREREEEEESNNKG